jgi:hypothetical protein
MRYLFFLLLLSCITAKKSAPEDQYRYHNQYVLDELDFEEEELEDFPEAGEPIESDTGLEDNYE